MSKLRNEARGRPCMVRVKCSGHESETTVLHHVQSKSLFGKDGYPKPDDMFGCWACSKCHDYLHEPVDTAEDLVLEYEAVLRTQHQLLKEGKITHE